MSEKAMIKARETFYKILKKEIDEKNGVVMLEELRKKSKVIKGYVFGVKSIIREKKKKYVYDPIEKPEYLDKIYKLVKVMGDNRFLGDYEKGYFLAWKDYIKYIKRFSSNK